ARPLQQPGIERRCGRLPFRAPDEGQRPAHCGDTRLPCVPMTTTVIHLVRHAEVENPDNIWYGHLEGFPLSAVGRQTAEALGEFFASHPLAAIYASPLERAQETAGAIARARGLEVIT